MVGNSKISLAEGKRHKRRCFIEIWVPYLTRIFKDKLIDYPKI